MLFVLYIVNAVCVFLPRLMSQWMSSRWLRGSGNCQGRSNLLTLQSAMHYLRQVSDSVPVLHWEIHIVRRGIHLLCWDQLVLSICVVGSILLFVRNSGRLLCRIHECDALISSICMSIGGWCLGSADLALRQWWSSRRTYFVIRQFHFSFGVEHPVYFHSFQVYDAEGVTSILAAL